MPVVCRIVKWGVLMLLGLALVGAAYQSAASAWDRRQHPAPGRLVDVGGWTMHLDCAGTGTPTIILDAGNGGITSTWAWIQPELARATRVCSYDRAGLGWSSGGRAPRTGMVIAGELHTLLDAAGETGPYLYVGHSMGGIYGRIFAAEHPADIAGLALVDASHPEQFARFPDDLARQIALYNRLLALAPMATRLGITRATNYFGRMARGLPAADYARAAAVTARTAHVRTAGAEFAAWDVNGQRLARAAPLGDLPLAVITAGVAPGAPAGFLTVHHANQRELAGLSSASLHHVIADGDHLSVLIQREHALETAAVILQLVARIRSAPGQSAPPGRTAATAATR